MSDTPTSPPRYTIGELAERAGVSRRTVRYYVQRELLPAPTGLGRGAHYTEEHLARLVRIRELQEAGVPLADVARALDPPPAPGPPPPGETGSPPPRPSPPPRVDRWGRVVIADGVELHVRQGALDAATLATLTRLVTTHLSSPSPSRPSTKENADD